MNSISISRAPVLVAKAISFLRTSRIDVTRATLIAALTYFVVEELQAAQIRQTEEQAFSELNPLDWSTKDTLIKKKAKQANDSNNRAEGSEQAELNDESVDQVQQDDAEGEAARLAQLIEEELAKLGVDLDELNQSSFDVADAQAAVEQQLPQAASQTITDQTPAGAASAPSSQGFEWPTFNWNFDQGGVAGDVPPAGILLGGLFLALAAGGGGSSAPVTPTTPTGDAGGELINGYIVGARVFQDLNANGQWDAGEPYAFTDAEGKFDIPNVQTGAGAPGLTAIGGFDLSIQSPDIDPDLWSAYEADPESGLAYEALIGAGAIPTTNVLKAPLGSTVVTPLTTLVQALVESGETVEAAVSQLKTAFGITSGDFDPRTYDPVQSAIEGDGAAKTLALQVKAASTLVANIMDSAASALAGATRENASNLTSTVANSIATQIKNPKGAIDLTDSRTLTSVITAAATATTQDNLSGLIALTAAKTAEVNNIIQKAVRSGSSSSALDVLEQIAKAQKIAQSDLSAALIEVAKSGVNLSEVPENINELLPENSTLGNIQDAVDSVEVAAPVVPVVFSGSTSGQVTEGAQATTVTGDLNSSDSSVTFVEITGGSASYGSYSVNSAGEWTYTLNNGNASVNALPSGQTLKDSFVVTGSNDAKQTVTVTIQGTEVGDGAVSISEARAAEMIEQGLVFLDSDEVTLEVASGQSDGSYLSGNSGKLGALGVSPLGIATLGNNVESSLGVDILDIDTNQVRITEADASALIGAGISFHSSDDEVTLEASATYVNSNLASGGGTLGNGVDGLGVDVLDIGGVAVQATLAIDQADADALLRAGLSFAANDHVTLDVVMEGSASTYLVSQFDNPNFSIGNLGRTAVLGGLGVDTLNLRTEGGSEEVFTFYLSSSGEVVADIDSTIAVIGEGSPVNDVFTIDATSLPDGESFDGEALGSFLSTKYPNNDNNSLSLKALGIDSVMILKESLTDALPPDDDHHHVLSPTWETLLTSGGIKNLDNLPALKIVIDGSEEGLSRLEPVSLDQEILDVFNGLIDAGVQLSDDASTDTLIDALESGLSNLDQSYVDGSINVFDAVKNSGIDSFIVANKNSSVVMSDELAAALADAGMFEAVPQANVQIDAGANQLLSTPFGVLAQFGVDKITTSHDTLYVKLGDVASVNELQGMMEGLLSSTADLEASGLFHNPADNTQQPSGVLVIDANDFNDSNNGSNDLSMEDLLSELSNSLSGSLKDLGIDEINVVVEKGDEELQDAIEQAVPDTGVWLSTGDEETLVQLLGTEGESKDVFSWKLLG